MGKLVSGQWLTDAQLEKLTAEQYEKSAGQFQRASSDAFRDWISKDGASGFKAEAGRYHLYGAINCPWAHRTLIYRRVKGLENIIGLSLVQPQRNEDGWVFDNDNGSDKFTDHLFGFNALYQLYVKADPGFSGRVTVPVLWDKKTQTIVNNESAEIIRMLNSAFDEITGNDSDFYPAALAAAIDELNAYIYQNINNGVYRAGFARTQQAYDENVLKVFAALDTLDERLKNKNYLFGDQITEADWRLLPTLVRFDVAYHSAFKCNVRMLRDYPHLSRYLLQLYQYPGVAGTVDLDVYRRGYHSKSAIRNPHGIVPVGPSPFYVI